jgi:hypothetical protein
MLYSILILTKVDMLLCSRCHIAHSTMHKFFYFKIEIKTKVDLYMPCKAMAHSTKFTCHIIFEL